MPTPIKRAAVRFGATIVDEREYKDTSGGKRDAMGKIPPPKDKDSGGTAAQAAPDYQVIIVADEEQLWGPFMPYRGGASRLVPVAGTPASSPRPGALATRNGARPRPTTTSRRTTSA